MTHGFDDLNFEDTTAVETALDGIVLQPTGQGALSGRSIVLDPGHGGHDHGAEHDGDMEKEINLSVAQRVSDILRSRGMRVIMTRNDDTFIELSDRAGMSNKYKPDVFVSVHTNDAENAAAKGIETFYFADRCIPFAQSCLDAMVGATGDTNRGVKHGNLAVLRPNTRICTLVEVGFLSNAETHVKLMTDDYRNTLAHAIADGVDNYLRTTVAPAQAEPQTFFACVKAKLCAWFGRWC